MKISMEIEKGWLQTDFANSLFNYDTVQQKVSVQHSNGSHAREILHVHGIKQIVICSNIQHRKKVVLKWCVLTSHDEKKYNRKRVNVEWGNIVETCKVASSGQNSDRDWFWLNLAMHRRSTVADISLWSPATIRISRLDSNNVCRSPAKCDVAVKPLRRKL